MKIIILGAGQVGGSLAQNLVKEASDITVVDSDPDKLRELKTVTIFKPFADRRPIPRF